MLHVGVPPNEIAGPVGMVVWRRCMHRGGDMTAAMPLGSARLHLAAVNMGPDTLDECLAAGDDPNVQDQRGRTPLHHAAFYGYAENVRKLLAAGADPNSEDEGGWTPWNAADSGRNDGSVKKMLRDAGGKGQSWLQSLFRKGR